MFDFYDEFDFLSGAKLNLKICDKNQGNCNVLPFYYYDIYNENDDFVGKISIRIGENSQVYYNGHMGYEIFENHRGNNYSFEAAKLVLQIAKFHGMEEIYITCRQSNIPSNRIIQKLGARMLEIAKIPPDCFFYYDGIEDYCIYQLKLK